MRRLSEQDELSRSWKGGCVATAARARESAISSRPQRCITPLPNLPPQGGQGVMGAAGPSLDTPPWSPNVRPAACFAVFATCCVKKDHADDHAAGWQPAPVSQS